MFFAQRIPPPHDSSPRLHDHRERARRGRRRGRGRKRGRAGPLEPLGAAAWGAFGGALAGHFAGLAGRGRAWERRRGRRGHGRRRSRPGGGGRGLEGREGRGLGGQGPWARAGRVRRRVGRRGKRRVGCLRPSRDLAWRPRPSPRGRSGPAPAPARRPRPRRQGLPPGRDPDSLLCGPVHAALYQVIVQRELRTRWGGGCVSPVPHPPSRKFRQRHQPERRHPYSPAMRSSL